VHKGFRKSILLLVISVVGLTAMSGLVASAQAPTTFVLADQMEPAHLDPGTRLYAYEVRVFKCVYEPLIGHKPGTQYELEPMLATSWEQSEDGLTYTFYLRQGVTFHDGSSFDAYDVKATFDRVLELNAQPRTKIASLESVEVVDDYTVNLTLSTKDIYFTQGLPHIYIISEDAIAEQEVDGDLAQTWLQEHEMGTGPYMLESWVRDDGIKLTKFDAHWNASEKANFENVFFRVVPDTTTQRLLLEQGDVHAIARPFAGDVPAYEANDDLKVLKDQLTANYMISLNTQKEPTSNLLVRQALVAAWPYQETIDVVFPGIMQRAIGPLAAAMPNAYTIEPPRETDLDYAKDLLEQAGYGDGLTLQMYVVDLAEQRRVGELFPYNLEEIGVTLEVTHLGWARMVEVMSNLDTAPNVSVLHASADMAAEAQVLRDYLGTGQPYNWAFYSNQEVDRLVAEARLQDTFDETGPFITQLQEIAVADAVYIYAGSQTRVVIMRKEICGYLPEPNGIERGVNINDLYWCSEGG